MEILNTNEARESKEEDDVNRLIIHLLSVSWWHVSSGLDTLGQDKSAKSKGLIFNKVYATRVMHKI